MILKPKTPFTCTCVHSICCICIIHICHDRSSHWLFSVAVFYFGQTGMPVCRGLRQHLWVVKADAPSTGRQAVAAGPMDSLWTTWKDALSGLMPGSVCHQAQNIQSALIAGHPPTHWLHHSLSQYFFFFLCITHFFNKHEMVLCLCKTTYKLQSHLITWATCIYISQCTCYPCYSKYISLP